MAGLVNERIKAFEEMARLETVDVKQTPVPKYFVGKLIYFYEHEVPAEVGETAHDTQVVKPVDEAFKAPNPPSECSSYWTARSHFEGNGFRCDNPHNEAFQNSGSQKIMPLEEEDEETIRRSRFIFHINAPATNISEARARAQRGHGVRRARFYLVKGMRILEKGTERRSARSPRKEGSQHSRDEKSTVKNTGSARKITNTDQSTSVVTQTRSENRDGNGIGLGAEVTEARRSLGKAEERSSASSPSIQYSRHSRSEKSSAKKTGSVCEAGKTDGKRTSAENTGSIGKLTKPDDRRSSTTNMTSVREDAKKESKKCSARNTESVRKTTNTDQSTSAVTQTRSEDGNSNRIGLGGEECRRSFFLFSRLWAKLRGCRGRTKSSRQGIVVHQLSRRVSSKSAVTIPIEVNVPYPRDAIESTNSFAATIQLKVSLSDSE